jgi:myo-inositol-1(or 4)-monophosphatase
MADNANSSLSALDLRDFKAFISELCDKSGSIIREHWRTEISVEHKPDHSEVTIADKKVEELLREMISSRFPEHGIVGEEFGITNPEASWQWVLDPIDGTRSFLHGGTDFGTLIALLNNGKPVLGAIHQPILNELVIGDNETASLNGRQVSVRDTTSLTESVLLCSDWLSVKRHQKQKGFEELCSAVKLCRTWGNCYGYALLAMGLAQIMIDPIMSFWDIAALVPVIQGAGGVITDYQGSDPVSGKSIVAAVPGLHAKVIEILNSD